LDARLRLLRFQMTVFLVALALILAGGVVPLLLNRQLLLLRFSGALGIGVGSAVGCVEAVRLLLDGGTQTVTFSYLRTFELTLRVDPLSAFFLMAIFGVSSLAALYSFHYMDDAAKPGRTAAHYLFFSLLVIAMALVVVADNMVAFLIAWEFMTLSSFFLVIYDYEQENNRKAAYQYFVFSHVGAMFIFAAFGVIFAHTGSLKFEAAGLSDATKILVFVLALIGFGSKAGVFPIHFWLPHAHPAAPSHISALMSGVMIKTGVFALLKIISVLQHDTALFGQILLIVGVVSGILGVVYALGQRDLKRLLAYSSVENIGIIFIGLGIGLIGAAKGVPWMAILGLSGALLHVLNHACFKSLLFLGAGMVVHQTGTRAIDQLGGLFKRMRVTGTTFLIGSLAIAGLPPFNGFVGELLIYLGSFQGVPTDRTTFTLALLAIIGLAVIGGLALACFTRVLGVAFQGEPRSAGARDAHEHGWTMLASMTVLAAACLVIGVLPGWFVPLAADAANSTGLIKDAVSLEPYLELTRNITLMAAIVLGGIIALVLLRLALYRGKSVTSSGTWGCGYTQPTAQMQYTGSSYAASILEFFRAMAPLRENQRKIEGRFPTKTHYRSHIEDMAESYSGPLIVRPVMAIFDRLRWIQHGDIHLYIGYILLAIIIILVVFVWGGLA
jgi:hydrogenase-4 component B